MHLARSRVLAGNALVLTSFPGHKERGPYQPHLGTHLGRYRCSLPGLAGFPARRCEGTDTDHDEILPSNSTAGDAERAIRCPIRAHPLRRWQKSHSRLRSRRLAQ
jgi:hypothetical protein